MSDNFRFRDELEGDLLERVRGLRPLLEEKAPQCERDRRVSDEVVQALDRAQLWALTVPRRWGGFGVSGTTMAKIWLEMAKGCPSTAWVHYILTMGSWIASLAPDRLQEELFADGIPRFAGGAVPGGTAIPTDGGYIVNGRWPYNSGCHNATWSFFTTTVKNEDGSDRTRVIAYVPLSQITYEDNWYVAGMKGTGSLTGILNNVFVPEHHMVHLAEAMGYHDAQRKHFGEPGDYLPGMQFQRATMLALLAGIAEAVLERVSESAKKKAIAFTLYQHQSDSPVIQREIGEAAAKVDAAKTLAFDVTRSLDEAALAKRRLTPMERARNRSMVAVVVEMLCEVVDKLMFVAGSGAFYETNDLQRYWRDLNMAARHANLIPNVSYEIFGRARLGVEPNLVPPDWI